MVLIFFETLGYHIVYLGYLQDNFVYHYKANRYYKYDQ